MYTQRDFEKAARILRGLTDRVRRLEREREPEGTVQQARRVDVSPIRLVETTDVETLDDPSLVWDERAWNFSDWAE